MSAGEIVMVKATDPGSQRDFQVFAEQSGNELLSFTMEEEVFFYWLKKS